MDYKAVLEKKKKELQGVIIKNPTVEKMVKQGMGATRKVCTLCKMNCVLSEFGAHKQGYKGLNSVCRSCKSKMNKDYYEKRKKLKSNE